jgi:uncharacterized protein (TIGR02996 family)
MPESTGDGAALLRAIIDNPDEDTPRLVYADWLDEQGGEANADQAEFIRTQIAEFERVRRRHHSSVGVWRFPTERERELIARYGGFGAGQWAARLPQSLGLSYHYSVDHERFARGFPWQAQVATVELFLQVAPALFEAAPITCLRLGELTIATARRLAASPHLARVRQWQDIHARRTDKMLAEIGKSEFLGNLREIDLSESEITAAGVRSLLSAPSLREVKRLTFASCRLGDVGAEVIAASLACAALEHLNLTSRPLTAAGVRALAASPLRETMRSLLLSNTALGDDAARVFAESEWPHLQYLILHDNAITDRGAEAFLDSASWRSSGCDLGLGGNKLSGPMAAKLKEAFGERVRV